MPALNCYVLCFVHRTVVRKVLLLFLPLAYCWLIEHEVVYACTNIYNKMIRLPCNEEKRLHRGAYVSQVTALVFDLISFLNMKIVYSSVGIENYLNIICIYSG